MRHSPNDVEALNRQFYDSPPYRYFAMRLALLLNVAASSPRYRIELEQGIRCGPLELQQDWLGATGFTAAELDSYIATETTVALHQMGEAVVRLYLAHLQPGGCPWIEVTRLRNGFMKLVRRIASGDALTEQARVSRVFLGTSTPTGIDPPISSATWSKAAHVHRTLLVVAANEVQQGAPLYNAAKHGMAVSSAHGPYTLSSVTGDPSFTTEGTWLTNLHRQTRKDAPASWRRQIALVNAPRDWLLMQAWGYMLKGLWAAGMAVHLRTGQLNPFISAGELDVDELLGFGSQSGIQAVDEEFGEERPGSARTLTPDESRHHLPT